MNKCQLLMKDKIACIPVNSLKGMLPPCGQRAIKQIQAISGEILWICQEHWEKLEKREHAVDLWNKPTTGKPN
jgi:hypothetical protein